MAQRQVEFTFTRNGNGATVAVNGAEGVTATIAATSASNAWNTGGVMASRTDVLCQNTNTSATSEGSPITYTLTVEGLNTNVTGVAFTHIAVNSGGNLQPSNNVDTRHCNFRLEANGNAVGTLSDQNIWIPSGSTDKTISFDNLDIAADGTLTIKLTLYKGTTNTGCFYGLTKITLAVPLSEDAVESNKTFNWITTTTWTDAEDLTSTVLNDNALGYGIKYIEKEITVAGARTATVTFQYTTGSCALNVRGVEVIDEDGNIVAGDYHVGKTGTNTTCDYTVKVAEAGTYTLRCYATFGASDRANDTNGNIVVSFTKATAEDFAHNITFSTVGYATLHLGYQVAVPAGVEAYVVSEIKSGYAIMAEVEGVIPAATPVILKLAEGASATATYTFAYTADDAATVESNLLKGSIADRYVAEDAYVLTKNGNDVCFGIAIKNQQNNASWKNNANKAYLPMPADANGISFYGLRFDDEEGTTAVENVEVVTEDVVIFDLSGRRVNEITAPGIYIVNGKKVIK